MTRTGRPRLFDEGQAVDRAKDVFWRRGYFATSIRELKDELGVLPGSLYSTFGNKHALFLRALDRYSVDTRGVASSLADDGPVLPRLRELLSSVLVAAHIAPGRGCMLGNTAAEALPSDAATGQIVRDAFRALEDGIERALVSAQRTGEVRDNIDCGAHSRLLVALVQGLHVIARAEHDPERLSDAIDAALAPLCAPPMRE